MRDKDVSTASMNTVVTKHGARLRALPQYALEARFLTRVHELISVFTMPAIPTSILRWKLPRGILHANTMPHSMTHERLYERRGDPGGPSSLECQGFVLASVAKDR